MVSTLGALVGACRVTVGRPARVGRINSAACADGMHCSTRVCVTSATPPPAGITKRLRTIPARTRKETRPPASHTRRTRRFATVGLAGASAARISASAASNAALEMPASDAAARRSAIAAVAASAASSSLARAIRRFANDSGSGWVSGASGGGRLTADLHKGLWRPSRLVGLMQQHPGRAESITQHREAVGERGLLHLHEDLPSVDEHRVHPLGVRLAVQR